MNRDLFDRLPDGAAVINVARGQHLVDEDLLAALDRGKMCGATLDVFHSEPLPNDHAFWDHPNVLVTPHIASHIDSIAGGERIAENIKKFDAGETIADLVPPDRGY